ncbi:hypothetical protein ALC57_14939 [Trachymyrmex cornetzi]|uniref:Uncharacterized protein n=1 Tax=Trachymyrmex cornetzi TaxID=471704 RepID=A0A195DK62_9HYME|nr:hypothetical protein ALC57_14939 [Trachymyrmex cornetzi]
MYLQPPRVLHTRRSPASSVRSLAYTRRAQRAVTPPPSIADRPSGQMVEKERGGQTS